MSTVAELLSQARRDGAEDAPLLLAHVLGKDRSWLYAWPEHVPGSAQLHRYLNLLQRRRQGEPLAYLTGEKEFWSLPLKVSPAVLIPRPETELLVELALSLELPRGARILELGTGSGAIAIALSRERADWHITATDASPGALEIARDNARRHQTPGIEFLQGDWYQPLSGSREYQLIISNPPYVAPDDPHLLQDGLPHEPRQALCADNAGLDDLETIIRQAPGYLAPGGWLLLEHGFDQGRRLRQWFAETGFEQVNTHQDLGGQDRVTLGCYSPSP
ncbi:peptide chain release factor N(5)-glutamine methyltransferase [Thiolapillus brandeum]|uniref:Release factor glutamine methyltransferase n=1 Tax=Thiolapillus brandeum TaxID=1076588 RepID=A0A7U6GGI1_9GAMM|nr:peptide chain release factor N(5)-glutamine methyltransferase [Thiolapillus brandeum]BAO43220.1 protoporphyrinogen oxidase [Thiolapillus brandeum]